MGQSEFILFYIKSRFCRVDLVTFNSEADFKSFAFKTIPKTVLTDKELKRQSITGIEDPWKNNFSTEYYFREGYQHHLGQQIHHPII